MIVIVSDCCVSLQAVFRSRTSPRTDGAQTAGKHEGGRVLSQRYKEGGVCGKTATNTSIHIPVPYILAY